MIAAAPSTALALAPRDPRPRSYALLNQRGADFELTKLGGGVARLSDYHGKVLILYFGGLWCPDCVADGVHVNHLAGLAAREPAIAFLNIHTHNRFGRWGGDAPADAPPQVAETALRAYFAETGYSYPVAFDPTRTFAREAYAIAWLPTYLILDRESVIRAWRTDLGARGANALIRQARAIAAA